MYHFSFMLIGLHILHWYFFLLFVISGILCLPFLDSTQLIAYCVDFFLTLCYYLYIASTFYWIFVTTGIFQWLFLTLYTCTYIRIYAHGKLGHRFNNIWMFQLQHEWQELIFVESGMLNIKLSCYDNDVNNLIFHEILNTSLGNITS